MWELHLTRVFQKSFRRLPSHAQEAILAFLAEHEVGLASPSEIARLKKLKGHKDAYRLRFGAVRVGVFLDEKRKLVVMDFAGSRGDFYKHFPPR